MGITLTYSYIYYLRYLAGELLAMKPNTQSHTVIPVDAPRVTSVVKLLSAYHQGTVLEFDLFMKI